MAVAVAAGCTVVGKVVVRRVVFELFGCKKSSIMIIRAVATANTIIELNMARLVLFRKKRRGDGYLAMGSSLSLRLKLAEPCTCQSRNITSSGA